MQKTLLDSRIWARIARWFTWPLPHVDGARPADSRTADARSAEGSGTSVKAVRPVGVRSPGSWRGARARTAVATCCGSAEWTPSVISPPLAIIEDDAAGSPNGATGLRRKAAA